MNQTIFGRNPGRLRVLIDGYFFDRSYGFGRVVREMCHALNSYAQSVDILLVVPERAKELAISIGPRLTIIARKNRIFPLWEQWTVPQVARLYACDVIHFPYQSTSLFWPRAATICTIHDLMFLRIAETSAKLVDRFAHYYRRILFSIQTRYVSRLVSVSAFTKDELRQFTGVSSVVISTSSELFISKNQNAKFSSGEKGRYFLHRGGGAHKNTERIVLALKEIRNIHPDVRLLIYGDLPQAAIGIVTDKESATYVGKVSDAELATLYKGALAVVVASLEEGFGLATVEAFGFGTPVITSDRSPMKDVAAGCALLVDPLSVESIANAMQLIITNGNLRDDLSTRGKERYISGFSAEPFAAALVRVYFECDSPRQRSSQ